MKTLLIISTILILISCGQGNKKDEAEQKPTQIETPKTEEVKKAEAKPIATGKITSIADGFDVQRVNLYNSTSANRTINCYLKNGDKVNILEDADPYYLVEKTGGQKCKGYCMKGFVIVNK